MSGYSGRRIANVSEHIQNLNQIPSDADLAAQQSQNGFEIHEDLATIMNTEFVNIDYDVGEMANPAMSIPFDAGLRLENATAQNNNNDFEFLNSKYPIGSLLSLFLGWSKGCHAG